MRRVTAVARWRREVGWEVVVGAVAVAAGGSSSAGTRTVAADAPLIDVADALVIVLIILIVLIIRIVQAPTVREDVGSFGGHATVTAARGGCLRVIIEVDGGQRPHETIEHVRLAAHLVPRL